MARAIMVLYSSIDEIRAVRPCCKMERAASLPSTADLASAVKGLLSGIVGKECIMVACTQPFACFSSVLTGLALVSSSATPQGPWLRSEHEAARLASGSWGQRAAKWTGA